MRLTFDEWLYKVCERIALKTRCEITEVYSRIDLSDAKMNYLDGTSSNDYKPF